MSGSESVFFKTNKQKNTLSKVSAFLCAVPVYLLNISSESQRFQTFSVMKTFASEQARSSSICHERGVVDLSVHLFVFLCQFYVNLFRL